MVGLITLWKPGLAFDKGVFNKKNTDI